MAVIELVPIGIGRGPGEDRRAVVLREKGGSRMFAFITDERDIARIALLRTGRVARDTPDSYDAWSESLERLGASVEAFLINGMVGSGEQRSLTGLVRLRRGDDRWDVPCGVSEGCVFALRNGAPIRCEEAILTLVANLVGDLERRAHEQENRAWLERFEHDPDLPKN